MPNLAGEVDSNSDWSVTGCHSANVRFRVGGLVDANAAVTARRAPSVEDSILDVEQRGMRGLGKGSDDGWCTQGSTSTVCIREVPAFPGPAQKEEWMTIDASEIRYRGGVGYNKNY